MKNLLSIRCGAVALVVLCLLAHRALSGTIQTSAFKKPVPEDVADLRAIEQAAREVAERVVPCTVGLQIGAAQGSGVIVTEDGYVLTAAHVVGRPGNVVRITLSDGTVVKGTTLGIHTVADTGLIKITDPGRWTHAPLVPADEGPKAGDWCLATGHANGYEGQRAAPVRLGRVIDVQPDVLRSDCPITGGDSGGPLFDMQGRVIGIHSRISKDLTENLHGPALACIKAWAQLEAGQIFPMTPASRFFDRLDVDRDGKISRRELPEGAPRRVFDRLADQFQLDPDKAHSIDQLLGSWRWRARTIPVFGPAMEQEEEIGQSLGTSQFVRGRDVRRSFAHIVARAAKSTVWIDCDGQQVALGTVVGTDGWILTKASQLSGQVLCRLADGRKFEARLSGIDEPNDLALLQIEAKGLDAVQWSDAEDLPAGSWVVTPNARGAVASVGVVSVGGRKIARTSGVLGVQIAPTDREARVDEVYRESGADEAGIRRGDVITEIGGHSVGSLDQLRQALQLYRVGDTVKAKVLRGETALELDVTLGAPNDVFLPFQWNIVNGPLSRRRDDFPEAFQHDSVLDPELCGGPAVDLTGNVIGINIARADRIATLALAGRTIKPLVARLRSAADSGAAND
jgi:serine protease Do